MESDVTQSATFLKLWAWADKNRKQVLWGLAAVLVAGLGIAFWLVHQNNTQNDANQALSKLMVRGFVPSAPDPSADALLKVAADYSGTDAGNRALLLGAAELFDTGKYDDARAQFQKFVQEHGDSPLAAQAALGLAACLDAGGQTNEAIAAYQGVIGRYPSQNVVFQARLAEARLLEGQGKFTEAKALLEEVARGYQGSVTSDGRVRLQELNYAHPELAATNANPTSVIRMNSTNQAGAALRDAIIKKQGQ